MTRAACTKHYNSNVLQVDEEGGGGGGGGGGEEVEEERITGDVNSHISFTIETKDKSNLALGSSINDVTILVEGMSRIS